MGVVAIVLGGFRGGGEWAFLAFLAYEEVGLKLCRHL